MYQLLKSVRFSDVLGGSSTLLPGAAYERDPTVDYQIHKAALYTMATCHSLRVVDEELLGDPLDIKMFEFTGWSFEELAQKANVVDQEDDQSSPSSIARPPPGLEYGIDEMHQSAPVSCPTLQCCEIPTYHAGRMHRSSY